MPNYKITVDEAVALSGGELNKDDVYSLIRANEVPGCIYIKDQEKERGKYLIIKPHWMNFLAGKSYKKIKTSNSTDQSLLDVLG